MLARTLVALLLLLAACPAPATGPVGPGPGPGPGAGPAPGSGAEPGGPTAEPPRTGPKLGETCGPGDTCGEGSCVKYYGIAGPRGPEFTSCEIRCDAQGGCADGRQCITVADGPGSVCRDREPPSR
jgi:hypothetical protein